MHHNYAITRGLLLPQTVLMAVAVTMGCQKARKVIYQVSKKAAIEEIMLRSAIKNNSEASKNISEIEIDSLLGPSNYIGILGGILDSDFQR